MASTSSLDRPLINVASAESAGQATWSRRPVMKISLVATAVMAIGLAGLFLFAPPNKDTAPPTTLEEKKTASVQEVLNMFPNLMNVKDANKFFAKLPPHDQEDMVVAHLIPQTKRLYINFLQHRGSSAPHWKTGERLSPRYKLEDAEEFRYRLSTFETSLRKIVKLNNVEAKHNLNPNRAIFAINQFADWTWNEFQMLLGRPYPFMTANATAARPSLQKSRSQVDNLHIKATGRSAPCDKNWAAEHPEVYKARSQSSCGSCYAHAAAECLRAQAFINTGTDPGELSVQYIMDCAGNGCNGGLAGNVMDAVNRNGGIPAKIAYGPYHQASRSCKAGIPYSVTTSGSLWTYAETHTASIVCNDGPIALGVAVNDAFQHYYSGVLSKAACPADTTNHDTQVVGLIAAQGAWLVRNSWGESWGINPVTLKPGGSAGYIMLSYGSNTCNVEDGNAWAKDVTFTSGCTGGVASCSSPTPAPPPPPPPSASFCSNTCRYNSDGDCDDGGPGSSYAICDYGTDCADCGSRPATSTCNDDCRWAKDGECDEPRYCLTGTDCTDCR